MECRRLFFGALILQQAFKKVLPMRKFLAVAIAFSAVAIFASSETHAQRNGPGYSFGIGLNQAAQAGVYGGFGGLNGFNGIGFGFRGAARQERQPFFAINPPVYYSGIVRRPYGISPFAAPAGITPVEMQIPVADPVTVTNPFFNKMSPASEVAEEAVDTDTKNKSTMVTNPYIVSEPEDFQLTLPASYETEVN